MIKSSSLALFTLLTLTLPAAAQQRLYRYECEGGTRFEAAYAADQARLMLSGREVMTLPQIEAASGVRYSDGTITLFTKGNDAFVEESGTRTYSACVGELVSEMPPGTPASPAQPVRGLW